MTADFGQERGHPATQGNQAPPGEGVVESEDPYFPDGKDPGHGQRPTDGSIRRFQTETGQHHEEGEAEACRRPEGPSPAVPDQGGDHEIGEDAADAEEPGKKALEIHEKALTVDTHCDTPMAMLDDGFDVGIRNKPPRSRVDFPRMKEGGLDAMFFAAFTGQRERTPENTENAYKMANNMIDAVYKSVEVGRKVFID